MNVSFFWKISLISAIATKLIGMESKINPKTPSFHIIKRPSAQNKIYILNGKIISINPEVSAIIQNHDLTLEQAIQRLKKRTFSHKALKKLLVEDPNNTLLHRLLFPNLITITIEKSFLCLRECFTIIKYYLSQLTHEM